MSLNGALHCKISALTYKLCQNFNVRYCLGTKTSIYDNASVKLRKRDVISAHNIFKVDRYSASFVQYKSTHPWQTHHLSFISYITFVYSVFIVFVNLFMTCAMPIILSACRMTTTYTLWVYLNKKNKWNKKLLCVMFGVVL